MNTFSIRDLRERTGELVRTAESGELSVVAKHGHPVFVAVPFSNLLLANGVNVALAVALFQGHMLSMGKAAKIADMSLESFMDCLGSLGIPVIDYDADDLRDELANLSE
jgi:prevent-host-death family protein